LLALEIKIRSTPSSRPRAIIFFLRRAGESSRRSQRFSTGETLALLSDEELFEAEIDPADRAVDLDGESEDEFVAEGDFVDSSGSQVLIPDDLLAPESTTILALAVSDTTPAARGSLLLFDPDCNDGDDLYQLGLQIPERAVLQSEQPSPRK